MGSISRYVEKLPRNMILENFPGVWSEEPKYLAVRVARE